MNGRPSLPGARRVGMRTKQPAAKHWNSKKASPSKSQLMARGAILDSDSDGAAPEEELAEERDAATEALEDQYAYKAKPMGEYDIKTMSVNDVKGRYRRYEKCELAWRNGKKVTVGFGWCIKVPYQRPEGTALSDEILLSLCVVSEILVEELPRKKAREGDVTAPLGDVIFKVAWLYSLGELVNDFPQYVHHRRQYPENERFFQVPMYPGDHQLQVYDDVDFTSVVSTHRVRFVIDRENIPDDAAGEREGCLFVNDVMQLSTRRGQKIPKLFPLKDVEDPHDGKEFREFTQRYLRRLLDLPWCKETNGGMLGSYELVNKREQNGNKRRRQSLLDDDDDDDEPDNTDDEEDDEEDDVFEVGAGADVDDDDEEMATGTPPAASPEPEARSEQPSPPEPEPAATAASAEGAESKLNGYTVLMENIMLKALSIKMPTIDTVRKMVPLAKELLMKLGDDCGDDERAFDRKVKELTDVLGRRRGLIHDLHDGAIDLDTLLEDAARAAAAAPAEPAATAASAEGPDSKLNRYVVLMENIMLKALGISMSTIDTVRKMVPLAIELLVKLREGCGDERAFVGKVEEMTEVLGRRRGLIQDLHDGAIDLDTLIQDAARGNAARGNGVRV